MKEPVSLSKLADALENGAITKKAAAKKLREYLNPPFLTPIVPSPLETEDKECPTCGISLKYLMGYCCGRLDCPCQLQIIC